MCQENEEVDLTLLEIVAMQQFRDFGIYKTEQRKLITIASNTIILIIGQIVKQQNLENKNEKQLYRYFKYQMKKNVHDMTWTWISKEQLKKETASLLITAPNNTTENIYAKGKKMIILRRANVGFVVKDWTVKQ